MKVTIILPTYNEKENILVFIPLIEKAFAAQKKFTLLEILVVDDNSPDGTAAAATKLNEEYGNITVVTPTSRKGIGAALRVGYNHAQGDIFLSSDADLSFCVEDMFVLLDAIASGNDLAVGCRHLKDEDYEKDLVSTKIKGFISKYGNKMLCLFTGIAINDFTANFRAITASCWRALETKENTNSILFEMILKAHRQGFAVVQVPVLFKERVHGESKLQLGREVPKFLVKFFWYLFTTPKKNKAKKNK